MFKLAFSIMLVPPYSKLSQPRDHKTVPQSPDIRGWPGHMVMVRGGRQANRARDEGRRAVDIRWVDHTKLIWETGVCKHPRRRRSFRLGFVSPSCWTTVLDTSALNNPFSDADAQLPAETTTSGAAPRPSYVTRLTRRVGGAVAKSTARFTALQLLIGDL